MTYLLLYKIDRQTVEMEKTCSNRSIPLQCFNYIKLGFFLFQGEEQKKLDVLSNEVFVKALISSGRTVCLTKPYV